MTEWSGLFLAIIAGATLVMALIQVGAIIAALKVAKQAQSAIASIQTEVKPLIAEVKPLIAEVKPLIAKAREVADEASRTATLATQQVQKVDTLVTDLTRRIDETSVIVQQAIVTPAREGIAIVAAIKSALGVFRGGADFRGRTRRTADDDDALFIG